MTGALLWPSANMCTGFTQMANLDGPTWLTDVTVYMQDEALDGSSVRIAAANFVQTLLVALPAHAVTFIKVAAMRMQTSLAAKAIRDSCFNRRIGLNMYAYASPPRKNPFTDSARSLQPDQCIGPNDVCVAAPGCPQCPFDAACCAHHTDLSSNCEWLAATPETRRIQDSCRTCKGQHPKSNPSSLL